MKGKILLCAAFAAAFAAGCEEVPQHQTPEVSGTAIVLNNGTWGGNDASIALYDPQTRTLTPDVFYAANGQKLGDLGQDVLVCGDEIYIAVNGSRIVFVTDPGFRITHEIIAEADGNRLSPRSLVSGDGKVYVTYYEGYLGEIDPSEDYAVRTVPVGSSPEGVAYAGGKVYVANSGGMNYPAYENTVSVVDAAAFVEERRIEVNVNPAKVIANADGSRLYVSSFGNYGYSEPYCPAMLQSIDIASGVVSDMPYADVSSIALGPDDRLYVLCAGYDAEWKPLPGTVYVHDASSDRPYGSSGSGDLEPAGFVTDGTVFPQAYSVSATSDGYVYVGCSDYRNTGDVYVMTPSGTLHDRFDSRGINPIAVR